MKSKLQLTLEHERIEKLKYEQTLKATKNNFEKIKKLDPKILWQAIPLDMEKMVVKDTSSLKFKSHNLHKQWIEFIEATFCKYKVPPCFINYFPFQFTVIETYRGIINFGAIHESSHEIYQEMFKIITGGESLRKYLKGTMTAKECSIFLTLKNDMNIGSNLWLSRLIAFGFKEHEGIELIHKFFHVFDPIFNHLDMNHIMQFFMKYRQELSNDEMIDLCDFLIAKYRANNRFIEHNFSLKGRTLSSVIALSNTWHQDQLKLKMGQNVYWERTELEDRIIEIKEKEFKFVELCSSRELFEEGKKQRHCVGSYVQQCIDHRCSIFSMRYKKYGEVIRITIEIRNKKFIFCISFINS